MMATGVPPILLTSCTVTQRGRSKPFRHFAWGPLPAERPTFNLSTLCIAFVWNGTLESHPFDIEFAILRFSSCGDATTSGGYGYRMQEELGPSSDSPWKLRRIFLSAHGNGCWYPTRFVGEERSVIDGAPHSSRPLLYSALGSHALYPNTRRNKRIWGFGDDKTNDRGLLWVPTHVAFFSPMFQVQVRTGNVQMQPPLKCLRLCDGQSELAPDPLLYLNMFRGEIGN
jgi:hypothetical protein